MAAAWALARQASPAARSVDGPATEQTRAEAFWQSLRAVVSRVARIAPRSAPRRKRSHVRRGQFVAVHQARVLTRTPTRPGEELRCWVHKRLIKSPRRGVRDRSWTCLLSKGSQSIVRG